MPPTARLATVEFRSLLLPPVRVRVGTLHNFCRPQCASVPLRRTPAAATCVGQRRSLYLYKTAKAKTALGMHKILDFDLYELEPPSASNHKVDLVRSEKDPRVVAEQLSLAELYENHISPGQLLYMVEPISKKLADNLGTMRELDMTSTHNKYTIAKAPTVTKANAQRPQTHHQQLSALKSIHLLLANPVSYTRLALSRAYQFIEAGSPVEFCIRMAGFSMSKQSKPADPGIQTWIHEHFPHLRPDFIRKSMPEGTKYVIKPVSDGRCVQFVLGRHAAQMEESDLTTRVFRVKGAVEESMSQNQMAQNYLVRKEKVRREKAQARAGGTGQDAEEKTSSGEVKTPFKYTKSIERHVATRGLFELDGDGRTLKPIPARAKEALKKPTVVDEDTGETQDQLEQANGIKNLHLRQPQQKHRWESRGKSSKQR